MPPPTDTSPATADRARTVLQRPSLIPASGDTPAPGLLYEALIRPHRSLTRPGFVALVTLYVALAAVPALWFLSRGAWP
ncbi:MAG: DUF2244 domain-containing protein, partial [Alphaproteobacteria bacterium]